jgi:hypothetical protein
MQKTAYENAKFTFVGLITLFGFFSVILFFSALNNANAWEKMNTFYIAGFIISGMFISGMAFTNFRSKEKTMNYLMLPASTLEKFISELLITTIVFAIAYTIIFYAFNTATYLLGSMYGFPVDFVSLSDMHILEGFMYYVIFQSIFLAGSATFRKVPLFFTSFTLFVAAIAILIFTVIITTLFKGEFENLAFNNFNINSNTFPEMDIENHYLVLIPKYMFYYLTAPVFWLVTYFKLKEKEA